MRLLLIFVLFWGTSFAQVSYDQLLKKYVSKTGVVDYAGLKKEENALNLQKELLEKITFKEKALVHYINLYNAATLSLILKHYGKIKSIRDINEGGKGPWDIPFVKLGSQNISLNDLEHKIIRKQFTDARVHFALVCAAKSCPPLRPEAYTVDKLSTQLDAQGTAFLNDASKNKISSSKAEISALFDWYVGDFRAQKSVSDWINTYSKTKVNQNTKITYKEYDWSLNGK